MYYATPTAFQTTPGQQGMPKWPSLHAGEFQISMGKGESNQQQIADDAWNYLLSSSQCVWVPAYIAYGLLDIVPGQNIIDEKDVKEGWDKQALCEGKGSREGKNSLAPQEQEFHQEMLRKLALHLVAQPDAPHETPNSREQQPVVGSQESSKADLEQELLAVKPKGEAVHGCEARTDGKLRATDASSPVAVMSSPFQTYICTSADDIQTSTDEGQSDQGVHEPWPSTPSSNGEDPCEKGANEPSRCWPSSPQCVCLPIYVAYGLLDAMASGQGDKGGKGVSGSRHFPNRLGPQEQEFHQQMLQKLALHLAAQPETLREPSQSGASWLQREKDCQGAAASKLGQNRLGPQEQEFLQQMLQKLALHLAAQPDTVCESSHADTPERDTLAKRRPSDLQQCKTDSLLSNNWCMGGSQSSDAPVSRRNWADITEESEIMGEFEDRQEHQFKVSRVSKISKKSKEKPMQTKPQEQEFHQQMLQKLALHLAAQPNESDREGEISLESSGPATLRAIKNREIQEIGQDKAQCDCLIAELEPSTDASRKERADKVIAWIYSAARTLSLTQSGSRLVQKAIDVASSKQLEQLAEALLHDTSELYMSPHANHVLAKLIEVMPRGRLVCIAEAMRGKATTVARHQFGSRILERLIEHCNQDQIDFLLHELLEDLEALARHQFGNFVVQRIFEHGTAEWRDTCVQKLSPLVLQHATHKTACNVVQRMLDHADLSSQAKIADAFLAGEGAYSLETIAATRYGSFVVHHLVDRFHPRIDAVKARVKAAHPQLQESSFSQRKIVEFLGEAFFRE